MGLYNVLDRSNSSFDITFGERYLSLNIKSKKLIELYFKLIIRKFVCCPNCACPDAHENNSVTDQLQGFTDQNTLLHTIFNDQR